MSKALEALTAIVLPTKTAAEVATEVVLPKPLSMDEKLKALSALKTTLDKKFQTTNSLIRLGSKVGVPLPSIGTDIYTLDYNVIGTGGIPRGRIIELFGPESSGKTTIALHCVAKEQQRGELCAYVDAEHALDPSYMSQLGVDVDNLLVSQPDSGEQALETAEALVESRAVTLIIVDSVAALVPQAELDGDMGDSHMGLQARLMSQAMRKLRGKCSANGVSIIFINQIREKLGVMFGNPETTTGGRALKFYASIRFDVRKVSGANGAGKIMSGSVQIGHQIRIKAVKNKVGPPLRSTDIDLIYGQGIDTEADFLAFARDVGVIEQTGPWFKFNGENIAQGLAKTIAAIKDDRQLYDKIAAEVHKVIKIQREQ